MGEGKAELVVTLSFREHLQGEWREVWRVEVTADLVEEDGEWLVRGSGSETLEGRRPF